MVNAKLGFEKLMHLTDDLNNGELEFVEYIDRFEKICFNDLPATRLEYFADGWSKGCLTTLMKLVLRASKGDEDALSRVRVDLGVKDGEFNIKRSD